MPQVALSAATCLSRVQICSSRTTLATPPRPLVGIFTNNFSNIFRSNIFSSNFTSGPTSSRTTSSAPTSLQLQHRPLAGALPSSQSPPRPLAGIFTNNFSNIFRSNIFSSNFTSGPTSSDPTSSAPTSLQIQHRPLAGALPSSPPAPRNRVRWRTSGRAFLVSTIRPSYSARRSAKQNALEPQLMPRLAISLKTPHSKLQKPDRNSL